MFYFMTRVLNVIYLNTWETREQQLQWLWALFCFDSLHNEPYIDHVLYIVVDVHAVL